MNTRSVNALMNLLIVAGAVGLTVVVFSWLFSLGFYGEGGEGTDTLWQILGAWIAFGWPQIASMVLGGMLFLLALEVLAQRATRLAPRLLALLLSPISGLPVLLFLWVTQRTIPGVAFFVLIFLAALLGVASRVEPIARLRSSSHAGSQAR